MVLRHVVVAPSEECQRDGTVYLSEIDRSDLNRRRGAVFNEQRELCWRYESLTTSIGATLRKTARRPAFTIYDANGYEIFRVRKTSFLPSQHAICNRHGQLLGSMCSPGVFLTKHVVDIDREQWVFHKPLFTTAFWGTVGGDTNLWVEVGPSKRQWKLLVAPGFDSPVLVCAIAFLHVAWNRS